MKEAAHPPLPSRPSSSRAGHIELEARWAQGEEFDGFFSYRVFAAKTFVNSWELGELCGRDLMLRLQLT
jgi:hypothetical protein